MWNGREPVFVRRHHWLCFHCCCYFHCGVTPRTGGGIAAAAAFALAYKKRKGQLPDETKYEKHETKHEMQKADGKAARTETETKR